MEITVHNSYLVNEIEYYIYVDLFVRINSFVNIFFFDYPISSLSCVKRKLLNSVPVLAASGFVLFFCA